MKTQRKIDSTAPDPAPPRAAHHSAPLHPRPKAGGPGLWECQAEYWAGYWHRQRCEREDAERRETATLLGLRLDGRPTATGFLV